MLVDHVRERIYLHLQVTDPMTSMTTAPDLSSRGLSAHILRSVFVFFTGLSRLAVRKSGVGRSRVAARFLIERGLLLVISK